MTQATDAALVLDDVRALRVQNGALRTLNHCLEQEIEYHRVRAQEYHAATTTLDSEREANRILTDTIEAQARRIEALEDKRAWAEHFALMVDPTRNLAINPLYYGDPAWRWAEYAMRFVLKAPTP